MALKLPRLPTGFKLINSDGSPTNAFQLWWQNIAGQLETNVNGIAAALEAAGIALDAADAAQAAADAADAAAAAASAAATTSRAETSLINSYVTGFTPPLISVAADGTVTIADHTRAYGDPALNPSVPVTGDTLPTTATDGQTVRVFYDDPARAGGIVTYQYTIDPTAPPVQGGVRHSVGAVTVPASGDSDGNYVKPPGYVEPNPIP